MNFGWVIQDVLKLILKRVPDLSHLVTIWHTLGPNSSSVIYLYKIMWDFSANKSLYKYLWFKDQLAIPHITKVLDFTPSKYSYATKQQPITKSYKIWSPAYGSISYKAKMYLPKIKSLDFISCIPEWKFPNNWSRWKILTD